MGGSPCYFYAFTLQKELEKEFKSSRNMNLFTERKFEIEEYEDQMVFMDMHNNAQLTYEKLKTTDEFLPILMTGLENHLVRWGFPYLLNDIIEEKDMFFTQDRLRMMNRECREAMGLLNFKEFTDFMMDAYEASSETVTFDNQWYPSNMEISTFSVFYTLFGELFR
jgi:hypothetical protein